MTAPLVYLAGSLIYLAGSLCFVAGTALLLWEKMPT